MSCPGEFPKLLWSPEHVEVTAHDAEEEAAFRKQGYRTALTVPPELQHDAPPKKKKAEK